MSDWYASVVADASRLMAVLGLLAAGPAPSLIDLLALLWFLTWTVGVVIFGYVVMFIDIRAYLRALRGALIRVVEYFPEIPAWARRETPGCLSLLGLKLPCTTEDVKEAYRKLAEQTHPDRGGSPIAFHRLRQNYEQALKFVREYEASFDAVWTAASQRPTDRSPDTAARKD